jgi:hypothetical protein
MDIGAGSPVREELTREGNTIRTQSRVADDAEPYVSLKALFGQARP